MTFAETLPKITNITMTAQLNCRISVRKLTNNTCNSILQIKPFNRCIIRLRNPKTTTFVYSNGKIVCVGGKSIDDARVSIRRVARMVVKTGYEKVRLSHLLIQNIAASHDLKRKLNLRKLHDYLLDFDNIKTRFDLKVFPNIRVSYDNWLDKTKLNVSRNGKIVITGVKSEEYITVVYNSFVKTLNNFN